MLVIPGKIVTVVILKDVFTRGEFCCENKSILLLVYFWIQTVPTSEAQPTFSAYHDDQLALSIKSKKPVIKRSKQNCIEWDGKLECCWFSYKCCWFPLGLLLPAQPLIGNFRNEGWE